tara:strand:+ start:5220 stop:7511 length:2292 start_codon:yes stop_codon:yes gene_type:complete
MTILIIVESPSKCQKIEKFLGNGYKCIASFGHICELTNILVKNNFHPEFKLLRNKNKNIKNLSESIKKASEVILATDDDREGEAIAWHICRIAKLPIATTKRIIFHEITEKAIKQAVAKPTIIDMKKVHAQLGRQVLDRLVGYTVSPTLWTSDKNNKLSAGRCQTPALRIVYDNQIDIDNEPGKRVFETTGYFLKNNLEFQLTTEFESEKKVDEFLEETVNFDHKITETPKIKKTEKKAPTPFSTSLLQQKASNEIKFSPKLTMQVAQKLYEGGHITYMRTDNKRYSKEFVDKCVKFIKEKWNVGENYIKKDLDKIMLGNNKKEKGAQEAHEAIRPTNLGFLAEQLDDPREKKLYYLIWTNTIESCMANAIFDVITANITAPLKCKYRRTEENVVFLGWMIVKNIIKDNSLFKLIKSLQEQDIDYNKISSKEKLKHLKQHYTEARLVQLLEQKGIGRPSTFSSLISKIQERNYVKKQDVQGKEITCKEFTLVGDEIEEEEVKKQFGNEKNKLVLQPTGLHVIKYLLEHFDEFFKYEYTGEMEQKLDEISNGVGMWQDICKECNEELKEKLKFVKQEKANGAIKIDENHTYMVSKWGPVVKCDIGGKITYKKVKKNLDIEQMDRENLVLKEFLEQEEDNVLGMLQDKQVVIKEGKYGLYVNWNDKNYSVKNVNKNKEDVVLEDVVDILLGKKSSNPNVLKIVNKTISIRKGKFGPYVFYKTERMSKPKFIGINQIKSTDNRIKNWETISNQEINEIVCKYLESN